MIRRVVQLVADDRVLGAEEDLEDAAVGVEARQVEDRRLHPEEVRDPALESVCCLWVPQMNRTDAIPKPHSSRARLDDSTIDRSSARPR